MPKSLQLASDAPGGLGPRPVCIDVDVSFHHVFFWIWYDLVPFLLVDDDLDAFPLIQHDLCQLNSELNDYAVVTSQVLGADDLLLQGNDEQDEVFLQSWARPPLLPLQSLPLLPDRLTPQISQWEEEVLHSWTFSLARFLEEQLQHSSGLWTVLSPLQGQNQQKEEDYQCHHLVQRLG